MFFGAQKNSKVMKVFFASLKKLKNYVVNFRKFKQKIELIFLHARKGSKTWILKLKNLKKHKCNFHKLKDA